MATMAGVKPTPLPANPTSEDWRYFRDRFNDYLVFAELIGADDDRKKALLHILIGREGVDILQGLPDPKVTYQNCIDRYNDYFGEKSSILIRRKVFFSSKQEPKETANSFACRLRRLSSDCSFGANRETLLRDIFVIGVFNDRLGEKLLAEDATTLTFELAVRKAEAFERAREERESSKQTVAAVKSTTASKYSASATSARGKNRHIQSSRPTSTTHPPRSNKPAWLQEKSASKGKRVCYRCGSQSHLASARNCPAKNSKCNACSKVGHWGNMCMSSMVRQMESTDPAQPDDSDNVFNLFAASPSSEIQRDVTINGRQATILIDTGADLNILPSNTGVNVQLQPSKARVQAWGQYDIPVLGKAKCVVIYKNKELEADFIVVQMRNHAITMPLFSLPLCRELGMIDELIQIRRVDFVNEYHDLFQGMGCLNTGFQYKASMKDDVPARNCPARRLPPAMMERVREELNKMHANGIIRQVTEPTDWSSPMLVTKKKSGDIRIVIDFRYLNTAIRRQNYQIPRLDDMLPLLKKASVFSALDGTSGYLQIPVHHDSQLLLTFSSPWGRWCFQRLPFGICSASEVFQQAMSDVLLDLPGVICYQDDILVYGNDKDQHDQRLKSVLDRLRSCGIKLNKSKCRIGVTELEFLGHRLSANGIAPSPDKVAALTTLPRPDSKDSLRSFLGMASYIGQRFVPNFSNMCQPLWNISAQSSFSWDDMSKKAFEEVKDAICKPVTLAYFNDDLPVVLNVDASPYGLGATITQNGKLVACASRKITPTESRYSQLEREFLALVFGVHRFRPLLIGTTFSILTDHKPLLPFFVVQSIRFRYGFNDGCCRYSLSTLMWSIPLARLTLFLMAFRETLLLTTAVQKKVRSTPSASYSVVHQSICLKLPRKLLRIIIAYN